MVRKLKTYQTAQGFYEFAIAAPSMKAALEAWGASSNLFRQGFAKESEDSKVIAAAMAQPGIVLRRPVGSEGAFSEHSDLPSAASLDVPRCRKKTKSTKVEAARQSPIDEKAERRAAAAYEKERQRRETQRQKNEEAEAKALARRKAAVEKAEEALTDAEREHEKATAAIEQEVAAIQHRAHLERERWEKLKVRLEGDLRKASG